MNKFSKVLGVTLALGLITAPAFAKYSEGPVSNGGTISGKISFKGDQPAPIPFKLGGFPQAEFCGKADSKDGLRLREDVRVKDGGLGDVVVYLEEVKAGKPFEKIVTKFVSDQCRFLVAEGEGPSRQITVVVNSKKTGKKSTVLVKNLDADASDPKTAAGVLHNPHGYDVKFPMTKTIFNKPLPKLNQEVTLKVKKTWFKKKEVYMLIECDQHNYMQVWAVPVRNPYYAVVNDDGSYTIGDVPAGKYKLKTFHQKLGFQTLDIEVAGGGTATGNFEYAAKK